MNYVDVMKHENKYCQQCARIQSRKVKERLSKEQLEKEIKELGGYCAVGRKYGVSDNSIRKWLKKYNKDSLRS